MTDLRGSSVESSTLCVQRSCRRACFSRMLRFRRSRDAARAFSLVEILVALLVAIVVLSAAWSLFSAGIRQFFAMRRKLGAAQVAQAVMEYVQNDLHAMILKQDGSGFTPPSDRSAVGIEFLVSRGDQASEGIYRAMKMKYATSPVPGRDAFYLVRNGVVLRNLPLKRLSFRYLELPGLDDKPGRPGRRRFIRLAVTALGDDMKEEFTMAGLVALDLYCSLKRHPHWNRIPTRYIAVR